MGLCIYVCTCVYTYVYTLCEKDNGPVSPNFERLLLYPFEGQIVDLDILGMITEQYCNNMHGEGGG